MNEERQHSKLGQAVVKIGEMPPKVFFRGVFFFEEIEGYKTRKRIRYVLGPGKKAKGVGGAAWLTKRRRDVHLCVSAASLSDLGQRAKNDQKYR